ncbi:MAG: Twin-arginine translocation protein, TatB subunit [Desulfonauticus sp. 38_4375]|nr:MAG: Twin-arginine translocation protein, TatB subunit [Desulfonauticus sp. 38_4375]
MFGIGSTELLVILVVALIVIGPSKLPEIARTLGKAMAEFKKVSTDVKRTIEQEIEKEEEKKAAEEAKKELESKQKQDTEQKESSKSNSSNEEESKA